MPAARTVMSNWAVPLLRIFRRPIVNVARGPRAAGERCAHRPGIALKAGTIVHAREVGRNTTCTVHVAPGASDCRSMVAGPRYCAASAPVRVAAEIVVADRPYC